MRIVVLNHVTLDGVMQGPGRPDEDTRGGFTHGGWAEPNGDDVMGRAWTVPRLYQRLGRSQMSLRTFGRQVREVAAWRRPRLVARGDLNRDQVLAALHQQLGSLPDGAVVLAEDETHVNLLPWVRATWIATASAKWS
jgi:hypothetical protein